MDTYHRAHYIIYSNLKRYSIFSFTYSHIGLSLLCMCARTSLHSDTVRVTYAFLCLEASSEKSEGRQRVAALQQVSFL